MGRHVSAVTGEPIGIMRVASSQMLFCEAMRAIERGRDWSGKDRDGGKW